MKLTLRATFDAAHVDLNGESYLLIKRSDFARLFNGAEVTAVPTITTPPARIQARRPFPRPSPIASASPCATWARPQSETSCKTSPTARSKPTARR